MNSWNQSYYDQRMMPQCYLVNIHNNNNFNNNSNFNNSNNFNNNKKMINSYRQKILLVIDRMKLINLI